MAAAPLCIRFDDVIELIMVVVNTEINNFTPTHTPAHTHTRARAHTHTHREAIYRDIALFCCCP